MEQRYNRRSPAVKRLMREAQELSEATSEYHAQPLEDNLFEWHFTVRGPSETDFDGGVYHGRIILPAEYPMKPPNIIVLTPNGRFEVGKKICLSISGHHPESWQPSWSIRTALLAIIGFMPTPAQGTIGSLDYPAEERRRLAKKSASFVCQECGVAAALLKEEEEDAAAAGRSKAETKKEAEEIAKQFSFKEADETQSGEKKASAETKKPQEGEAAATEKESEATKKKEDAEVEKKEEEELSAEQQAIRERKAASKAAQQRFRERLQRNTKALHAQIAAGGNPGAPQAAAAAGHAGRQAQRGGGVRPRGLQEPSWGWTELLIVVLLAGIGVIIARRFSHALNVPTADDNGEL